MTKTTWQYVTKIAAEYFQLKLSTFQVAVNETVKHCYRPLVSDCDVEGKSIHFLNLLSAVAYNKLDQVPHFKYEFWIQCFVFRSRWWRVQGIFWVVLHHPLHRKGPERILWILISLNWRYFHFSFFSVSPYSPASKSQLLKNIPKIVSQIISVTKYPSDICLP